MTRVVVLGGGFAGVETIRCLDKGARGRLAITLVSDKNYLLFTPLLPQVGSSLVEPRHIIQPIRDLRGHRAFRFRRDRVEAIDLAARTVACADGVVAYDRLVIALGGVTPTFDTSGVEEHAVPYKWLEDAIVLRDRLIDLAEHADHEPDRARRRRLLTIGVVGGGYTGVELITELQDFLHSYVVPRYRGIEPGDYRLLLVEAGPEILRGVHPTLAQRARRRLDREGIEVRTNTRVTRVFPEAVEVTGGATIEVGLTVWAAGVKGHPLLASLPVEHDRLGRLVVDEHLCVPGYPGVYAVGDAATIAGRPEASIPIIPAALAHARLVAANLLAELDGRPRRGIDFAPRGMLVSLGQKEAVVEVMGVRFAGYAAWLFWNALHLFKLVGFRKQLQVALDWWLAGVFPRDSAIMRPPAGCPICAREAARARDAA